MACDYTQPSAIISGFKPDLKFLSKKMGIPLPVLPLTGSKEENKLFADLLRQGPFDSEKMAREWCRHVDGSKIFPTLPVYLRTHHESYLLNCPGDYSIPNQWPFGLLPSRLELWVAPPLL